MPVTADSFVQSNTGGDTSTSTTHVVSLPSGTAAGNTIVAVVASTGPFPLLPASTAWCSGASSNINLLVAYLPSASAGETSWTFTTSTAALCSWYVVELSDVDATEPFDVKWQEGAGATLANGTTYTLGTAGPTGSLGTVAFAATYSPVGSGETASWDSWTNGFTELADFNVSSAAVRPHLAVAYKTTDLVSTSYQTAATMTRSGASDTGYAVIVAFKAADAPINQRLAMFAGFEWGTHGGIANTSPVEARMLNYSSGPTGTWGTNYDIGAGYARSSSYGLRIVQSAALTAIPIGFGSPTTQGCAIGMNVRVVSGSGTPVVAELMSSAAVRAQLVYDVATTKFGVRCGSAGTISYQSGTTALNTWVWIDLRFKNNSSVWHADWRIETGTDIYTDQTGADLTGQSATSSMDSLVLGNALAAQTMTAHFDDVAMSRYYASYPVTPHQMRLLVPETTGASVSGTPANFQEFTANGTLAAFASTSGQRIDEVPPTVSAAADGVAQVTAATTEYMQFPMTTYTLASDEVCSGVRMYAALWGGTGTGSGQLGIRGYDGTTETILDPGTSIYDAASPTALANTAPLWSAATWNQSNGWNQSKLDPAALRVGFSADATPDMGISAAYLEVAVRKVPLYPVHAVEDGVMTAHLYVNPYNSAAVSYVITNNDPTRTATFNYSVSGTPQTPVTVAPGAGPTTLQLNAEAFGDISETTLTA